MRKNESDPPEGASSLSDPEDGDRHRVSPRHSVVSGQVSQFKGPVCNVCRDLLALNGKENAPVFN